MNFGVHFWRFYEFSVKIEWKPIEWNDMTMISVIVKLLNEASHYIRKPLEQFKLGMRFVNGGDSKNMRVHSEQ